MQSEACSVTGVLAIHQQLMYLLNQLHGRDLNGELIDARDLDLNVESHVLHVEHILLLLLSLASFLNCVASALQIAFLRIADVLVFLR